MKKIITDLINKRSELLNVDYDDPIADKIENEIIQILINNFNDFEVDFVTETITYLGYAPQLIYNDNGKFAIGTLVYFPVSIDEPIEGSMVITFEKDEWKDSIREALYYYLINKFTSNI